MVSFAVKICHMLPDYMMSSKSGLERQTINVFCDFLYIRLSYFPAKSRNVGLCKLYKFQERFKI